MKKKIPFIFFCIISIAQPNRTKMHFLPKKFRQLRPRLRFAEEILKFLLANLYLVDLVRVLVVLPPTVISDVFGSWAFGVGSCKVVSFVRAAADFGIMFTLTYLACCRWRLWKRPFFYLGGLEKHEVAHHAPVGLVTAAGLARLTHGNNDAAEVAPSRQRSSQPACASGLRPRPSLRPPRLSLRPHTPPPASPSSSSCRCCSWRLCTRASSEVMPHNSTCS